MANQDLSSLSWEEIEQNYPDIYRQYVSQYGEPTADDREKAKGGGGSTGTGYLTGATDAGGGAYPLKPLVPDPRTIAAQVSEANLANLDKNKQLAAETNKFNQEQALLPYTGTDPNFMANRVQESGNVASQLRGEVPLDVWRQLQQRGGERGIGIGSPGSPNANAALMAALGTNSIALQNLGRAGQHQLYSDTPVGKQLDPASMNLRTEDLYNAELLSSIYASQADARAQAQELIRLQQQAQRNALNPGGGTAQRNMGLAPVVGGPPLGATPLNFRENIENRLGGSPYTGTTNLGYGYTGADLPATGSRVGAGQNNSWYTTTPQSSGPGSIYMGANDNAWFNQNWNQPSTNPWEAGITGAAGNTFETGGWKPASSSNFFEPTGPLGSFSTGDYFGDLGSGGLVGDDPWWSLFEEGYY